MLDRIYLDNAATSWPKPPNVVAELSRYYSELGVAAGRGTSAIATEVDRTIEQCRSAIAKLINCDSKHVVFAFNGTDAINMALHGLIENSDGVVTSAIEHNSVLRPLKHLERNGQINLSIADAPDGIISLDHLKQLIRPSTKLCCVSQASNVTGLVQPVLEIAKLCKANDVMLVIDAAQSVGHLPVDFQELGCDVLVASGHKGLLGPLGTGFLCLSKRAANQIKPTRQGGTGTQSELVEQPNELPFRLESGNLNVGGIFGLLAGINFITETGIDALQTHERTLRDQLLDNIRRNDSILVHGQEPENRTGVISFNIVGQDCHTVAATLDSSFAIQVRAGLHCAPLVHDSIGSSKFNGTIRISPGAFSTQQQIEYVLDAINKLTTQLV